MPSHPWYMVHIGIGPFLFYAVLFILLGYHWTNVADPTGRLLGMSWFAIRRGYLVLLAVVLLGSTLLAARVIVHTVLDPPVFDYQGLWMYGRVTDSGQNPYLPGPYHAIAGPGPYPLDFYRENLDVGSMYPPPSHLLFGAFGWMPLRTAIIPWMLVQLAAFAGVVALLWRTFYADRKREGLALVLVLALLLSLPTFGHGQISFLAILCVLAAWRTRDRPLSGIYLGLAPIVKLLYCALWLYPLLRRRWLPLLAVLLTSVSYVLASIALLGSTVFETYLYDNPVVHRFPSYYFKTFVNQSLLGASLRLMPYNVPPFGPPVHHPLYLASAAIVGLATAWAVWRLPKTSEGEDTAFTLLILAGMLIYPWTLSNYYVLLLVPMGFLLARRTRQPLGVTWTLLLVGLSYPIMHLENGNYSIVVALIFWGATLLTAISIQ